MYITVLTTLTVKVPLLVLLFIITGCGTVTGVMGDVSSLSSKKNVKSEKSSKYTTAEDLDTQHKSSKEPMHASNTNYNPNMSVVSQQMAQPMYQQQMYQQPVYQPQPMMYNMAPTMAAPIGYGYQTSYAPQPQYYVQQQPAYYAPQPMQSHASPSYGGFGDARYYSR